jgi:uncharacterized protein YukE
MSDITLADLLVTDPAPAHTAAAAWKGLADDLDTAADDLNRNTQDLRYAWSGGQAAPAAEAKVTALRAEVNAAYNPANRIAQALTDHANAMADLRSQAETVVGDAKAKGFLIDAVAGTVTIPAKMLAPAQPSMPPPDSGPITAKAQEIASSLATLVSRARGLDDTTVNAIRQNLPDRNVGFGSLTLPPVTREDVLAQRGRDPKDINAWWRSLTPAQRDQAIAAYPELVGWLDGVPAVDRDRANRIALANTEADLRRRAADLKRRIAAASGPDGDLSTDPAGLQAELSRVNATLKRVDMIKSSLGKLGQNGLLLGVDFTGDGKAIIAVGNPDTAKHTAVWVPGVNTTIDQTPANVNRVLNLQKAADALTTEPNDVATVMWLGYDAPEVGTSNLNLSAVTDARSKAGAQSLDSFINGLRTTHDGGAYHVTAVGHSYGSTVVAQAALHGDGLAVDDIVTAGSPGMDTAHATDFININARHVWAGSAADDPISNTTGNPWAVGAEAGTRDSPLGGVVDGGLWAYDQGHGESPHVADFGANQYVVDTHGHSDYWKEQSQSLDNQARIVVGKYDDVRLEHGSAPTTSADEPR